MPATSTAPGQRAGLLRRSAGLRPGSRCGSSASPTRNCSPQTNSSGACGRPCGRSTPLTSPSLPVGPCDASPYRFWVSAPADSGRAGERSCVNSSLRFARKRRRSASTSCWSPRMPPSSARPSTRVGTWRPAGPRHWELDDREMAEARRLGGLAAQGHLALFLGAGVSMAAGLPSWGDLIKNLGERVEGGLPKDFDGLDALDQAEFLATRLGGAQELNQAVIEIIGRSGKIALAHALLAGMACGHAVTTNYDNLYERAVEATGRARPSVLPWESVEEGRPWLLKLHGDIDRTPSIVLTRRDFVLFDAKSRPAGSLLQALLLTKHVLIIGASLSDGNVIRLAMEVDEYLQKSEARSIRGTFVDTSGVEARQELWRDQFRWFVCEGKKLENRVRRMEMFLDAVAAYAATDAPWLLDERFDGLLDDRDRGVVDSVRRLVGEVDNASALLDPLKLAFSALGARPVGG
ncbi:Hypothetical protein GP2_024_00040 [Gordonia paraffinivorans NBRC 108238]|uniref:SIR2-like domain-containing protein n=1 Tax=Gordonia paraffinivorans NBRC 108238 TaxID=1223543 RepID=A0ABQ0ILZ7_9ACTN|nr:Hypothetical protein GP2_024_00040 [Gordonia paraffinivorans NBRC 108238]